MVALDLRTLLLVLVLVSVGCAALSAALSRVNNRRGTLSALAWAEALLGIGFALVAARSTVPDILSYVVANVLIVAGYGGHWVAVRRLTGQRFPWGLGLLGLIALAAGQGWLTFVTPSLPGRILLISGACVGIAVCVVRDTIRHRAVARALIPPHLVFAVMMASRFWLALAAPDPDTQPFLTTGTAQQGYFLGILLVQLWMAQTMLWCIGMDWYREVAGAVAARQRAEQCQQTSETRLQGLMGLESACIAFLDAHTRVVDASPSFCRLLGVNSPRDLIGETLLPHTAEADRERVALLHRALSDGQIGSYRVRKTLLNRQGNAIRVDLAVGPLSGDCRLGFVVLCTPLVDAPPHTDPDATTQASTPASPLASTPA